jgi:hypothetical protein
MDPIAQWRLKDRILSAALSWVSFAPRWSFGGNRLQLKAEMGVLADVLAALRDVKDIGARTVRAMHSFQPKEDLLNVLLENEQARLKVWLFPLGDGSGYTPKEPHEVCLVTLLYYSRLYCVLTFPGTTYRPCKNRVGGEPFSSYTPDDEIPCTEAS